MMDRRTVLTAVAASAAALAIVPIADAVQAPARRVGDMWPSDLPRPELWYEPYEHPGLLLYTANGACSCREDFIALQRWARPEDIREHGVRFFQAEEERAWWALKIYGASSPCRRCGKTAWEYPV